MEPSTDTFLSPGRLRPDRGDGPDVRDILRRVGRLASDGRSLGLEQGRALFGAMLDRRIDDLALGGLLIALRMRGETVDEAQGALQAVQARTRPVTVDPARPVLSIASYGGSRHGATLTPLVASLLADAGVQVIVHGVATLPGRTTSAAVFRAMGIEPAQSAAEAGYALERGNPAFIPIDILSPALADLLVLRERLGVRHIGHALASLLDPAAPRPGVSTVRLGCFTHPAYARLQRAVLGRIGGRAVLLRGHDGEPVTHPRRMPRAEWVDGWQVRPLVMAGGRRPRFPPPLPPVDDVVATAAWIQSMLAGEQPLPDAVAAQVELILAAIRR